MKNILFASSEVIPYVKTGGLADVVGSLPRYLDKKEYDVRIILPKYACMDKRFQKELKFVCQLYVNLNWRRQYVGLYKAEKGGVKYYFIDNEYYFSGNTLYGEISADVEKFAYFSKAVLESLPYLDWTPDIIHCNDWQTGLIPVFLRTSYGSDLFYSNIRTIFSIHNLRFQGINTIDRMQDITGLPSHIFNSDELEAYGMANCLKGGVVYSDRVTTVSPTYAREITTPEGGEGLHGLMQKKGNKLSGILNGLDYDIFNSMTDAALKRHYNKKDADQGKKVNERHLQKLCGLPEREDVMVLGIVSRLTDQKGFDLIASILDELLATTEIQLVLLGTGEPRYEKLFHDCQNRYPEKMNAFIGYSEARANQIYAGSDAFLMPSMFEPCGLSQLMAMHYGTLPIVRETGGLKDTVKAWNEYGKTGTGFSFANYNAAEMLHVIRLAAQVFYDRKEDWKDMVLRAMNEDFSWNASAREYQKLYDEILDK